MCIILWPNEMSIKHISANTQYLCFSLIIDITRLETGQHECIDPVCPIFNEEFQSDRTDYY